MKGSDEIDLHSCSNELQLLLRLLNEEEDSIKLIEDFHKKVDWKEFLQLVYFHKVYPSIYLRLSSIDLPYLPNNVVKIVEGLYKDNTIKMLQLIKELDNISTALTKSEIRMLTLKGPILSYYLYGDLSSRTSNDLDILISFQDLKSTIEILQAKGYEMEYEPPRKLKDWQKETIILNSFIKRKIAKWKCIGDFILVLVKSRALKTYGIIE
ncbi:nucleotidyltransferase family protein [Niallia circulans]